MSSVPLEPKKHQSALSVKTFRRYLPSSCLSTFGGWMVRFLLGWSAWSLTESALWVGVVAGLMLAPSILLSPVFGIVSDRINPRNGLIATVALQGLITFIAGIAELFSWFTLPCLLGLAISNGVISAAHTPIRLALIPLLVPRAVLPSAVGFSAIIFNTSRILAPAAAAWLITQTSVARTFFCATVLIVFALPFLISVNDLRQREKPKATSLREQFNAGLRYVQTSSGIKLVFAYALLNALFGRTIIELMPALSGQLLNGDAVSLAKLTASAGVGSILGGVLMSRQSSDERKMLTLLTISLALGALCLFPIIWLNGLASLCVIVVMLSLVTTTVGTGTQILTQLLVDDGYRGRVLSLWTVIAMGGSAFGVLITGALADYLGFIGVLPVLSLVCIAGVTLLFRRRHKLLNTKN